MPFRESSAACSRFAVSESDVSPRGNAALGEFEPGLQDVLLLILTALDIFQGGEDGSLGLDTVAGDLDFGAELLRGLRFCGGFGAAFHFGQLRRSARQFAACALDFPLHSGDRGILPGDELLEFAFFEHKLRAGGGDFALGEIQVGFQPAHLGLDPRLCRIGGGDMDIRGAPRNARRFGGPCGAILGGKRRRLRPSRRWPDSARSWPRWPLPAPWRSVGAGFPRRVSSVSRSIWQALTASRSWSTKLMV